MVWFEGFGDDPETLPRVLSALEQMGLARGVEIAGPSSSRVDPLIRSDRKTLTVKTVVLLQKKRETMEKQPQNIQDGFLNSARKEKTMVTVYLLSGVKLTGRIRSFDKYSVILDSNNQEQMIFKHAIATVVLPRADAGLAPRLPP